MVPIGDAVLQDSTTALWQGWTANREAIFPSAMSMRAACGLDAAKPHLLRIVGPNCLGFLSPHKGIDASFAHLAPAPGRLAFLTQSGAAATTVLDWAAGRGVGFSHVVSLGDMSDVDFGDLLDYLALDLRTGAILLYVESVTHARKFMTAARIASRSKPVVVVKAGRSEAGAKAALSHTGALAGADAVYDAALHRAGALRVGTLSELFEAARTLAAGLSVRGDRLAILTNGGGLGVLAADALEAEGCRLATLSPATLDRLGRSLPPAWSRGNPVDLIGDATGERYVAALEAVLDEPDADAILVMNCPTAVADSLEAAQAVTRTLQSRVRPRVLTCWLGEAAAEPSRRLFDERQPPAYETPEGAVRAFAHIVRHRRNQELLLQTPPSISDLIEPDREAARAIVENALGEGRSALNEAEAKGLLEAYGIPVAPTKAARDPAEAGRLARALDPPFVLKILSQDVLHKSDVGGVRLDLATPEAVEQAAAEMAETVRRRKPEARIEGFTVQHMAVRPGAHELIAGIAHDPTFGPIVLFGQGGIAVEVVGDRVIGFPPLNLVLARDMIERTRVFRLLRGYRHHGPADLEAVALTLVKLGQLAADLEDVAELDVNPLLADSAGALALDARAVVRRFAGDRDKRLAIRPYPRELERRIALRDGSGFFVRPIRPEDAPLLQDMLKRCAPEDVRLRFFAPVKEFGVSFVARLTQIDYDREMALVALPADGGDEIAGVVRLVADPDGASAEFAVMVRSDLKGHGLGSRLMTEILAYARVRGVGRVFGDILPENVVMRSMAEELGFRVEPSLEQDVVRVEIRPDALPPPPA